MSKVELEVLKNGPVIVTGEVCLKDHAGAEYKLEKKTIALCRCGHSSSKPFCDGAHVSAGFTAEETAK